MTKKNLQKEIVVQQTEIYRDKQRLLAKKWLYKRDVYGLSTVLSNKIIEAKICNYKGEVILKPKSVLHYKENMGLVDKTDMLISYTNFQKKE